MGISVCMATYNGEAYIVEQLKSILTQLKDDDEVIVVEDCSKDGTVSIIEKFNDSRIKIYLNKKNSGHVYSFGRAISLAKNDIIFMADQDDIWVEGRVDKMREALLETKALLVSTNSFFIDQHGQTIDLGWEALKNSDSAKSFRNIMGIFTGKTNYFGCAMAFRKELVDITLPIPSYVESHDLWIAMAANMVSSNLHLEDKTLYRRIHGNNDSQRSRKLWEKLWSRIVFIVSSISIFFRIFKNTILIRKGSYKKRNNSNFIR